MGRLGHCPIGIELGQSTVFVMRKNFNEIVNKYNKLVI